MNLDAIPGWSEMSPAELLAYLQAPANSPRPNPVTVATMISTIGKDATRRVLGTIQAASTLDPILGAMYQALATTGISLHQPERQAMIDELATVGGWSPELAAAVKSLGVDRRPRWQLLGMLVDPTIESVTEALANVALENERQSLRSQFDAILNQIGTVEQPQAIIALRSIADGLED